MLPDPKGKKTPPKCNIQSLLDSKLQNDALQVDAHLENEFRKSSRLAYVIKKYKYIYIPSGYLT